MTADNKPTIAELKNKLKRILEYSHKYSPENIKKILEIEKSLEQQEFKIGIVANMSAGKSTFVNALFGKNILPAYNHATTDCATFIHSEKDTTKKAKIIFNDEKPDVELGEEELSELQKYAQKDTEVSDEKHKNVEEIHLYYPFLKIQTENSDDIKILFVDTPGPNSTGGDYSEKHRDQTRSVLSKIDLALFIFDYGQLDANLTSDKQGLWHTIKERYEKDTNFEIFFLLNKIDAAFNDNFKGAESIGDDDEYKKFHQKNWYSYEQKGLDKLINAAKTHKINEPKVYPMATQFALHRRIKSQRTNPNLASFKSTFRTTFGDETHEDEIIKYLGISKLEEDINHYINTIVKEKIANKLSQTLQKIIKEENSDLQRKEQTLKKPQEEAEKNLKNAQAFIQKTALQLEQAMKSDSSKIKEIYKKEIIHLIDERIQIELQNKVNEIAIRSIFFAQAYVNDNLSIASKTAKFTTLDQMKIDLNAEKVIIRLNQAIKPDIVKAEMYKFLLNLFHECKRRYLDVRSDIKECYHKFDMEADDLLENYKRELEKNLNTALDIKIDDIQKETIERVNMPELEIDVPDSVLDYKFEDAKHETRKRKIWGIPIPFTEERVQTRKEKHEMQIKPKEILESIKASIEKNIANFYQNEIGMHEANIDSYLDQFVEVFQDFRHKKEREIDKLSKEVKDSESQLKALASQKQAFQKSIIEGVNNEC